MNGWYGDMLEDPRVQFTNAYEKGSPNDTTSWMGHQERYNNEKNHLRNLIDKAIAMKCLIPAEAFDMLRRPAPKQPLKFGSP
jgi:hypothetical protein